MVETKIHKINPDRPDERLMWMAVDVIKKGGIVAFPTETVYALGVDAYNEKAVKRIYKIKRRDPNNPLSIFLKSPKELNEYVEKTRPVAEFLMKEFWPGPLTLIFKSNREDLSHLRSGTNKLGIRISSHNLVDILLTRCEVPLTATSANVSGRRSCSSAAAVRYYFNNRIDLILDGGRSNCPFPSSVVDLSSEDILLLRQGAISLSQIRKVAPQIKVQRKF
jgi:L-threonylcarbamoyladenylate synthase